MMNYKQLNKEIKNRNYENIIGLKAKLTKKEYWYLLEVLPPIYTPVGFLMSEPLTHTENDVLHLHCYQIDKSYYCEVVGRKQFVTDKQLIVAGMI